MTTALLQSHSGRRATSRWQCTVALAGCVIFAANTPAQRVPEIGYIYPAGGQQGTSFEVTIGGQFLGNPRDVVSSGDGLTVEVVSHHKPLPNQVANEIRDKLRKLNPRLQRLKGESRGEALEKVRLLLAEEELDEDDLRAVDAFTRERNDPKKQPNRQISETVRVRVTVAKDAEPGIRYWRLKTAAGLSIPMRFVVGQLPEVREPVPEDEFDALHFLRLVSTPESSARPWNDAPFALPVTVNGRILPGEIDEFSFQASEGQQIVVALRARELIPYLADAVPGWFQPIVSVHDSRGTELAFADDYRHNPDPVIFCKIPEDGEYRVKVRDSIYRGREDFVYRISVGELPFLTGLSPLGAKAGSTVDLRFCGGNLKEGGISQYQVAETPGIVPFFTTSGPWRSNTVAFHIDTFEEDSEREPNDSFGAANGMKVPGIINGVIDKPGDVDFFQVRGRGDSSLTFEILARRLGSPLDSVLTVFDDDDRQIAFNDDHDNPAAGLETHHADSRVTVKLPGAGKCTVRIADTQRQGGSYHAYRLKITPTAPSFALRVTPSSVNLPPGGTARLTIHALRCDGFDREIALALKSPPGGFELVNAGVPAGQDRAEVILKAPAKCPPAPLPLAIEGSALIDDKPVVVEAVAADDKMQAFIYRHLVPADTLLVNVRAVPKRPRAAASKR